LGLYYDQRSEIRWSCTTPREFEELVVVTVTVAVTGVAKVEMEGVGVIVIVRTLPVVKVKTVDVFEAVTV